jgi:hypothetical protein
MFMERTEPEAVSPATGLVELDFNAHHSTPTQQQRQRQRARCLFWAKVQIPARTERCVVTVLTANGSWDIRGVNSAYIEGLLRRLHVGDLILVSGRVLSEGRAVIAEAVEVVEARPKDWVPTRTKPKARRRRILNPDWRQLFAFGEIASLWNERPEATTSKELERTEHSRKLATSEAGYDAVVKGDAPQQLDGPAEVSKRKPPCEDEWAGVIRNYASSRDRIYVAQISMHIQSKFRLGKFGKKEQLRVGDVFISMGWDRFRDKMGRGFVNRRPSPSSPQKTWGFCSV